MIALLEVASSMQSFCFGDVLMQQNFSLFPKYHCVYFFDCFFIKAEYLRILFSKAFEILNTKLAGKLKGSLREELLHSLLHHKSLFTKKAFRTFSEKLKKVFTTQSFDAYLSFKSFHEILSIKKQSLCKEIFMTDLNRVILNFSAWICLWW